MNLENMRTIELRIETETGTEVRWYGFKLPIKTAQDIIDEVGE